MWRRAVLIGVVLLASLGCGGLWEDQAGSTTGPTPIVHCDAQDIQRGYTLTPGQVGDTTVKVVCPGGNDIAAEVPKI